MIRPFAVKVINKQDLWTLVKTLKLVEFVVTPGVLYFDFARVSSLVGQINKPPKEI